MKTLQTINSPIGAVWHYSTDQRDFDDLRSLGFRATTIKGKPAMEANIMSGLVAKAINAGFTVCEDSDSRLFTLSQVADYLAGWQAADDTFAHHNALVQLRDEQDGLAAVVDRANDARLQRLDGQIMDALARKEGA